MGVRRTVLQGCVRENIFGWGGGLISARSQNTSPMDLVQFSYTLAYLIAVESTGIWGLGSCTWTQTGPLKST